VFHATAQPLYLSGAWNEAHIWLLSLDPHQINYKAANAKKNQRKHICVPDFGAFTDCVKNFQSNKTNANSTAKLNGFGKKQLGGTCENISFNLEYFNKSKKLYTLQK